MRGGPATGRFPAYRLFRGRRSRRRQRWTSAFQPRRGTQTARANAMTLPCSLAWEAFGQANGAADLTQMRARILRYRDRGSHERTDFQIGCRVLHTSILQARRRMAAGPPKLVKEYRRVQNLLDGKRGRSAPLGLAQAGVQGAVATAVSGFAEDLARFGQPTLIRPRLGQGAFRVAVTDVYQRRCAVTGERTLPALDAAHIRPYSEGGEHSVSNGLLLRRAIHCLFDLGYVTVTPNHRFEVSPRIREEFENGRDYYRLGGRALTLPDKNEFRPDVRVLDWHYNNQFLGGSD